MQYRDRSTAVAAPEAAEGAHAAADAAHEVRDSLFGSDESLPNAEASVDGDIAADVNEGSEWSFFSLHHTSVGISFGAVAFFLLALAVAYGCFHTQCCGIFACCNICPQRRSQAQHGAVQQQAAPAIQQQPAAAIHQPQVMSMLPPPYVPKAIEYDPYTSVGPSSAASVYGVSFGGDDYANARGIYAPPLPPARTLDQEPRQPRRLAIGHGHGDGGRRPRERSPSNVSRVFLLARANAARYAPPGRFSDVTHE